MLKDCERTPITLRVNGDFPVALAIKDGDIDRCSADKAALRKFYEVLDNKALSK